MDIDSVEVVRSRSKKPAPKKTKRLEVRITDSEMDKIKMHADRHGLTVSGYAIRRLLDAPTDDDTNLETRHRPHPETGRLYQSLARANILLNEIREHLAAANGSLSRPLLKAVLVAMIAVEKRLTDVLWK
jgi:hypothetical protein